GTEYLSQAVQAVRQSLYVVFRLAQFQPSQVQFTTSHEVALAASEPPLTCKDSCYSGFEVPTCIYLKGFLKVLRCIHKFAFFTRQIPKVFESDDHAAFISHSPCR